MAGTKAKVVVVVHHNYVLPGELTIVEPTADDRENERERSGKGRRVEEESGPCWKESHVSDSPDLT